MTQNNMIEKKGWSSTKKITVRKLVKSMRVSMALLFLELNNIEGVSVCVCTAVKLLQKWSSLFPLTGFCYFFTVLHQWTHKKRSSFIVNILFCQIWLHMFWINVQGNIYLQTYSRSHRKGLCAAFLFLSYSVSWCVGKVDLFFGCNLQLC